MESILTSIKKLLGISEEYEHFDDDIIIHINTVFSSLRQLGAGPESGFVIADKTASWQDFLGDDPRLQLVKSFVYLKVRLLFDPPQSSAVMEAVKRLIDELEFRIIVETDKG